jgi:hypothetical protein
MTLAQATAVTTAARAAAPRTCAYVIQWLCTGLRTEEARALRWHQSTSATPAASRRGRRLWRWRSVRARGDAKTRKSRRTLGLPRRAISALQALSGPLPHKCRPASGAGCQSVALTYKATPERRRAAHGAAVAATVSGLAAESAPLPDTQNHQLGSRPERHR